MRLRTASVAALAALALITSACSGDAKQQGDAKQSGSTSAKPALGGSTLVIWADDKRAAALKPLADKFGSENGVTIQVQAVSKDLQTAFVSASQAGKGPDVVVGAHDWIGNLVQNGAIDPVQLTGEQKNAFAGNAVKAVTFNGQTYAVPYAVENLALIRNTELAPNAPASIEDLVAAGQGLVSQGKAGEIMALQVGQTGDIYHMNPLYTSGGGYLFGQTPDGQYDPKDLGVGKPGSVEAFKKIRGLGESGSGALKRSISGDNSISLFTAKKTAFLVSGPWALPDLKKANLKYEVTPVPAFAGGKPAQPFIGVQGFYVASKGKNKVAAEEFVTNYLTRPDVAVALYNADPRPPALSQAQAQIKGSDPDMQKFLDAGQGGAILPAIPAMAAVFDPLDKAEAAIVGGADVDSTVAAAAKAISELINK